MESQQEEQTTIPTSVSEQESPSYNHTMLYVLFAIEAVTIAVSFVLLFGLLIPLLIQLKNKRFHQGAGRRRNSTRQSFDQGAQRQRTRPQNEPLYSTYNLYLVYLALVDLAFFLPMFAAEMMAVNQTYRPRFYSLAAYTLMEDPPLSEDWVAPAIEESLWYPYNTANLWINAVIAYEVLVMLQATHRAQRIDQPSLRRVNLQVGGVLLYSVVYGVFYYYWPRIMEFVAELNAIPVFSVIGISVTIHRQGLMPPLTGPTNTPRNRAVRGLAFYFFRIAMVFLVVWLPAMTSMKFKRYMDGWTYIVVDYCMWVLMYLQPTITFCLVLTKDDVRKYVKDLVTLTYIFGDCTTTTCSSSTSNYLEAAQTNERTPENRNEPNSPTANRVTTILGFDFSDADDEDDIDAQSDDSNGNDDDGEEDTDPTTTSDANNGDIDADNRTNENDVDAEV